MHYFRETFIVEHIIRLDYYQSFIYNFKWLNTLITAIYPSLNYFKKYKINIQTINNIHIQEYYFTHKTMNIKYWPHEWNKLILRHYNLLNQHKHTQKSFQNPDFPRRFTTHNRPYDQDQERHQIWEHAQANWAGHGQKGPRHDNKIDMKSNKVQKEN